MINLVSTTKVYLAVEACDMRKQYNGLYAQVVSHLQEDPVSGALFVFSNRRRNRLKILYFDGTGLWVLAKRLEKGKFSWPVGVDAKRKIKLAPEALQLLISGVDLQTAKMRPWYQR